MDVPQDPEHAQRAELIYRDHAVDPHPRFGVGQTVREIGQDLNLVHQAIGQRQRARAA